MAHGRRRESARRPRAAIDKALADSRKYNVKSLDTLLDDAERAKVAKGKVVSFLKELPGSPVKLGVGIGVIDFPPAVVIQVLNDFEHYKGCMPYVKESRVDHTETRGDVIQYFLEIKAPLVASRRMTAKLFTEENVDGIPGTMYNSWSLVPGGDSNLPVNDGSWKLVPYGPDGQKTLAFYTVITDPGGSIPNWMKNKSTEIAMPGVYEAIAKRAAAGLKAGDYELPPPEDRVDKDLKDLIAATASLDAAYVENLPQGKKENLLKGNTLTKMKDVEGTWTKMAQAVAIFDAPPRQVYKTITDYGQYKDFISCVAESTVDPERSKGNVVFVSQRLDFGVIFVKNRFYTIKLTDQENLNGKKGTYFIQWVLDNSKKHNVIKNVGSWKLVPFGEGGSKTLVFYTVMADPGGFSPWFWKNLAAEKAVNKVIKQIGTRASGGK